MNLAWLSTQKNTGRGKKKTVRKRKRVGKKAQGARKGTVAKGKEN